MKRLALLLLAACGPIPLADAERICLDQARLAQAPRGEIGFGIGSGGQSSGHFALSVSSDYVLRRDPDAVYGDCVRARSGQSPSYPYSSLPQSRM